MHVFPVLVSFIHIDIKSLVSFSFSLVSKALIFYFFDWYQELCLYAFYCLCTYMHSHVYRLSLCMS